MASVETRAFLMLAVVRKLNVTYDVSLRQK
jgi:hypothetical protein